MFAKTYNIQNQTNYDMNPAPSKNIPQSLDSHVCGTHFLIAFLKLLRDFKDFILSGTWFQMFRPR